MHCFTRGRRDGEAPNSNVLYSDRREARIFDLQRYRLSLGLPQIVETLIDRKCYHAGRENFFSVEMLDDERKPVQYEVYFAVWRASGGRLNLIVQSAYVRDKSHTNKPQRKPIRFHVILFNTQNGNPITVPK
jgi:hypothetical protein